MRQGSAGVSEVLASLLAATQELKKYFDVSSGYLGSLKLMPSAKKK
jgi:hypothetical protein